MNLIRSFFIAFSMYSKIPMPRTEWTKEAMKYAMCFFPLIGVVIGGVMMLWACFGSRLFGWDSLFFTAVCVLIPVAVTGGIHLDGLLDTADALSSYKPMEQKLEILKDSHAGAFAIIIGICYFVADLGIYSELTMEAVPVLALSFLLSRAFSGLAIVTFRMAKNTGLAATFSDMAVKGRVKITMLCYIVVVTGLMIVLHPGLGTAAFAAALVSFFGYRHMAYSKFGGITGDLAGFYLQICELLMAAVIILGARLMGA
ncbi:MAG: adenosylcobinamide-GDP ribazoletransferase [Candidatus Limivivens sp.]|nr:adenosylcobinamide-GDP ribazoletransferase [Candidatus Limivivens sp.]